MLKYFIYITIIFFTPSSLFILYKIAPLTTRWKNFNQHTQLLKIIVFTQSSNYYGYPKEIF